MFSRRFILIIALILFAPAAASAQAVGIVLLVESAVVNDEKHLRTLETVVSELSNKLTPTSRLGISAYNSKAFEISPFEPIAGNNRPHLLKALKSIPQGSPSTNPASALEQAIYKLRTAGRHSEEKLIIVLGDGLIESDDEKRDFELSQWLRDELAGESSQTGIRIFWLTFSESADYRVIQTVTQKTGGSYFRAYSPAETRYAIESILVCMQASAASSSTKGNTPIALPQSQPENTETSQRSWQEIANNPTLWASMAGLIVILLVSGFYLKRYLGAKSKVAGRSRRPDNTLVVLRDVNHFTGMAYYDITEKRTYIGRQPREVTEHSCIIVIRDTSVGRNHATIEYQNKDYWISDSGTVNGTYINGKRLHGSQRLLNSDRIRFAKFEFEITIPKSQQNEAGNYLHADTINQARTTTIKIPEKDEPTIFSSRQ